MAVTLQQIADMAGVSRGTVDRALNNRGRIRPEVAEKIKKIAKELGYRPSRAGRALVMAKRNVKIGVIIQSIKTPFMLDVLKGIEEAQKEVESMGTSVEIYKIEGVDATKVIENMNLLHEHNVNGIALSPSFDEALTIAVNKFTNEYKIPIVTFNSDLERSDRICFIGQNARQSGQTAAGLMGEIISSYGKVVIISSHKENLSLKRRAEGFINEMALSYPNIEILGTRYAYEDNWVAQKITEDIFEKYPYIDGIYITGAEVRGVCAAIKNARKSKEVKVIANDILPENIKWLCDGTIDFLIGQDAYTQGYQSVMVLFQKLFDGTDPEKVLNYTDIVIKNKYNV